MMADKPRKIPNVWAKNLSKLLGGDDHCWYRAWYQAHFWTAREELSAEDKARMDGYQIKHDAIANARAAELSADGWLIRMEDDAAFKMVGKTAELTGKPDVVALSDRVTGDRGTLVVDAKSGKRRPADVWQVLIYMFALPLTWLSDSGVMRGEVRYSDGAVEVPPLRTGQAQQIVDGVRKLAAAEPPEATPSKWECEHCLIEGCAVRYDESAHASMTSLF